MTYDKRGTAFRQKSDFDLAIADYNRAIRLKPLFGEAYYDRGTAFLGKGEQAKAEADFAKAKQLGYTPPSESAASGLGYGPVVGIVILAVAIGLIVLRMRKRQPLPPLGAERFR